MVNNIREPSDSECHTQSSEPFIFYLNSTALFQIVAVVCVAVAVAEAGVIAGYSGYGLPGLGHAGVGYGVAPVAAVAAVAPAVAAPHGLAVAAPHAAVDYYVSVTEFDLWRRFLNTTQAEATC
jgi:hypothetical protein